MKHRWLILVGVWVAAMMVSHGQTPSTPIAPPAAQDGKKSGIKMRFSSLGDWTGPSLAILTNEKAEGSHERVRIPVELSDMGYSPEVPIRKDQPLVLIEKDSPSDHPKVVLQLAVPAEIKQPLLLLIPSKDKIQHRWFDIDPSVFPYGSIHVVNYSKDLFGVICGQHVGKCDVGMTHRIPNDQISPNQEPVLFSVGNPKTGQTHFKTMIIRRASKRMMVFFVTDPAHPEGPPVHRMLVDFEPS